MKVLQFVVAAAMLLVLTTSVHAQGTSQAWVDVVYDYGADNLCTHGSDDGPKIQNAINAVASTGGVVFFPPGCYLVSTQIVDTNSSANGITYLGYGRVQIQAGNGTTGPAPSNSIIQFGNNTTTVARRKIVNLEFNCNTASIDGVDINGLTDFEFDDVDILACHGSTNWHLRTVGSNTSDWNNMYIGGVIDADASNENGINLGSNSGAPYANAWSFVGTKILATGSSPTGIGLDFEGAGMSLSGGVVSGWGIGVSVVANGPSATVKGGFEISGNYIENNQYFGIRVGYVGGAAKPAGVTISGNYINCNGVGQTGVSLQEVNGYSVISNHIKDCTVAAIDGTSDGTSQGSDNGFVGANFIDGGQPVLLYGSNNTVSSSIGTQASNYILAATDTWVNVTGTSTITVPNNVIGQRWDVFNSGSSTVTLVCYTGTINGTSSVTVASQTGKSVITDGTNCFAH